MTPDVDDMSTGRLIVELAKDVAALAAIVAIIAITGASVAIGAMRECFHAVYPIGLEASEEISQLIDREETQS